MKNFKNKLAAGVLAFSLLSVSGMALATDATFGATAALADPSYTLEEMLEYAIQDEFAAQAEYLGILNEFGTVRIFNNIVKAEGKHIEALLPLFGTHEIAVPVDNTSDQVILPSDLASSYAIGVEAEVKNIAMYEAFLKEDLPEDVRFVFENLKSASENHLAAFTRAASGNQGNGLGQARQNNNNGQGQQMEKGNGNLGVRNNAGTPRQQLNNRDMTCR